MYNCYNENLIFDGEYLNGQRNGKGKEFFDNDYISYEGEYFKGKRNGKGKEYNYKGNLIFDGEYLNGKRWNGIGYNNNNSIIYELKNGKGYIKEYDFEGILKFEG